MNTTLDFDEIIDSVTKANRRERNRLVAVAEEALAAHDAYAQGMRYLDAKRYGAALRHLRDAVELGLDDVQPLMRFCENEVETATTEQLKATATREFVRRSHRWYHRGTELGPVHHYTVDLAEPSARLDAPVSLTRQSRAGNEWENAARQAATGDPKAVERLLSLVVPIAVRYCRARLGGRDLAYLSADDVAQEVCLAVLHALPYYEGGPFLRVVHSIAEEKVADAQKPAYGVDPATRAAKLLGRLDPREREIVILRILVGLSVVETAEALGISAGAVRVGQHRALNRLRAMLHQDRRA